jgi:hypothetical protein
VLANIPFKDLRHQRVDGAAAGSQGQKYLPTIPSLVQNSFNAIELASDPDDTGFDAQLAVL